ncbi:hypothetical protein K7I13_10010 [Brucepastera parasyntrophica]|uniref:TDE1717 family outer membrane beta-barrel protein n=1 Tax=Brucepastera parasyntrophica TaxID=2880008 RepID=UPI002108F3BF|nr:hypothetical protein [Brucepastera parasyntrophica]ULQ58862.1 hypothetical protein K7I13_10010 [Brucepastera parasyntrophica]
MKKLAAVLMCAVLMVSGTFAIGLSAGLGGQFDLTFLSEELGSDKETYAGSYFGAYGFVDLTYLEFDIGVLFGSTDFYTLDFTFMNLGLYAKYPFKLGFITLAPMIGIDYQITLALDPEPYGYSKADFNTLWVKLGAQLDINLGRLFIRGTALFGIETKNVIESDLLDYASLLGVDYGIFKSGLDFKAAIGYRFL